MRAHYEHKLFDGSLCGMEYKMVYTWLLHENLRVFGPREKFHLLRFWRTLSVFTKEKKRQSKPYKNSVEILSY